MALVSFSRLFGSEQEEDRICAPYWKTMSFYSNHTFRYQSLAVLVQRWLNINLVPRVLSYSSPGARERETLENAGHVSPRIREMTKDNIEGGAVKSGVWPYLAHPGLVSTCIKNNTSGLCHSKLREVILPARGQNVEY